MYQDYPVYTLPDSISLSILMSTRLKNNNYDVRFVNSFLGSSAGIGRTGTFIVIDNLVKMIKEQGNVLFII